jgi:serine/threonine-protein kinase
MTALCAGLGGLVYAACRSRRIPPARFYQVALLFEVAGALGIMAGYVGWEHHGEEFLRRVATGVGMSAAEFASRAFASADIGHIRLLYHEGVSWVAVWLLTFSLVVPFSMKRTVVATLLTAATVPIALAFSNLVNGVPETVRPWMVPYVLEATIPTFICAGLAIMGSRVVYGLTRDLSKAQQLGSYQLVQKIGAGGMGEVWKAKHRLLARPAAIKFIKSDALSRDRAAAATALQRFEREAQATSGLSSQHSIDLYDFGITDDGTFYYVMELLEGVDLRTLVERYGPGPAGRPGRRPPGRRAPAPSSGTSRRPRRPGNGASGWCSGSRRWS